MSEKPIVPINCFFQGCYNPAYEEQIRIGKDTCHRYNQLSPNDREEQTAILSKLLGKMGRDVIFVPPFWCDYGYNITVGDFFYANHNLVIQDGASVSFGDNVFIAPNCTVTTAEHAIDPELRKAGVEIAKPIKIGNNVWIGGGSIINPGVTIGNNVVVGSGSVVTKSFGDNVVIAGNPAKIIRHL
jgi:acetyltransferase-like isoleucine patch superfamily enzyme